MDMFEKMKRLSIQGSVTFLHNTLTACFIHKVYFPKIGYKQVWDMLIRYSCHCTDKIIRNGALLVCSVILIRRVLGPEGPKKNRQIPSDKIKKQIYKLINLCVNIIFILIYFYKNLKGSCTLLVVFPFLKEAINGEHHTAIQFYF